jgi:hypothetical protein
MVHGSRLFRLLLAISMFAAPLAAQQHSFVPVDSGKVIRFQAGGVVTHGRLLMPLTLTSESVAFCRFPGPPCVPPVEPWQVGQLFPATLEHLEVQIGNKAVKGAWIGGVLGGATSFLLVSLGGAWCEYDCPSDMDLVFRAVVNTGIWAGVGALIGSGSPRMERRF